MTQYIQANGTVVGVTAIEVGPCQVTQVKSPEKEGYAAVQIGFGEAKRLTRGEMGHLGLLEKNKKGARLQGRAKTQKFKYLREFRPDGATLPAVGHTFDVSLFQPGDRVDIVGTTRGKGFAGTVKRHGFAGGPKTHGQSDRHRAPGSVGATTTPGKVFKGMRMAGHMGHVRHSEQGLRVVMVDPNRNLLLVRGSVPGGKNGLLIIKRSFKASPRPAGQGEG